MTHDSFRAWTRTLRDRLPLSSRWGLVTLFFLGLCITAVSAISTDLSTLMQRYSDWALSQEASHLEPSSSRLQAAVTSTLKSIGLPATSYSYDRIRSQYQSPNARTLGRHQISVPPDRSLAKLEDRLGQTLRQFPQTILARRTRQQRKMTTVALTTGVHGESTDIFVLTQPQGSTVSPPAQAAVTSSVPALPRTVPKVAPELTNVRVAIVIDDIGWDLSMAKALLALNIPLSFAIIPQSSYQVEIAQAVQQYDREILLHLPMEPHGYPQINPGQHALLSTMSPSELTAQLQTALQLLPMAVGVNNHMGSRLTEDPQAMRVVMRELYERDLFFLDSRTSSASTAYQIAREVGLRAGRRQVFLDHDTQPQQIARQLQQLIALAQKHGHAIGIGHPYPETLRALQHSLPEFRQAGVALVPISHLIH